MARGRHGGQSAYPPSFLPAADEEVQQRDGSGLFFGTAAGAGSEEHPSLTDSDCVSIFGGEAPAYRPHEEERYYSALLAAAGSEEQPSLAVSDYIPSLLAAAGSTGLQCRYEEGVFLPAAEDTGGDRGVVQTQRNTGERRSKCVFRTQSEEEVLKDGYKWRKYGKKSIKNTPHKRNYYRCSAEGCGVKKKVERDAGDPSYVLTTYEGKHCHPPPDGGYYSVVAPPGGAAGSASAGVSNNGPAGFFS